MSRFIIYGLIDPRDGELFYVGRSMSGTAKMKRHVQPWSLKSGCKTKNQKISEIISIGQKPTCVIIEECRNRKQLMMRERILIAHFSKFYALTNKVGNFNRR